MWIFHTWVMWAIKKLNLRSVQFLGVFFGDGIIFTEFQSLWSQKTRFKALKFAYVSS